MNIILLQEPDRLGDDTFRVTGSRARHVTRVLRSSEGDTVRVGLLEGPLGSATVVRADEETVELAARLDAEPPPRPRLDLILAIPRPKALVRLLPQIAALGVDRLVLLRTWRVAKPYLSAHIVRPEHYRPLLHEGLMQARCTREPRVTVEPLFKPFVEDRAPDLFAGARRLVAHPTAETPLASVQFAAEDRVALAVGPDGGARRGSSPEFPAHRRSGRRAKTARVHIGRWGDECP